MTIHIESLTFPAIIGLLERERRSPQKVRIDARLTYAYRDGNFLDYAEAARLMAETVQKGRFELVEEALEALFVRLKRRFPQIETANIRLCKPDILPDCRVCVEDFRTFL